MPKMSDYDVVTSWASGDRLLIVSDPGGATPATKGITIDDVLAHIIAAAYASEVLNSPADTDHTIDWTAGNKQMLDLTSAGASMTLTFTAPHGPASLLLKILQPASAIDITWPAEVVWDDVNGEPVWTDDDSKIRFVTLYYDGTTYWAGYSPAYTPPVS